jgi:hypothetical protein
MSKHGLGSLADLARILEEASNPESELREDRKETKPKAAPLKRSSAKQTRVIDPKRKAWYEKRLQEQAQKTQPEPSTNTPSGGTPILAPAKTKAAAVAAGANLLESLAAAKDAKPKTEQKGKSKVEAWRRKPGDPIF